MPKKLYFYLFVIVFLAVAVIFWPQGDFKKPEIKIENFEQCVAAGYPVMESYPRQCQAPNGENFVETFISEN